MRNGVETPRPAEDAPIRPRWGARIRGRSGRPSPGRRWPRGVRGEGRTGRRGSSAVNTAAVRRPREATRKAARHVGCPELRYRPCSPASFQGVFPCEGSFGSERPSLCSGAPGATSNRLELGASVRWMASARPSRASRAARPLRRQRRDVACHDPRIAYGRGLGAHRALGPSGDENGGHVLAGHVDGTAEIVGVDRSPENLALASRPVDSPGTCSTRALSRFMARVLTVNGWDEVCADLSR